MMVLIPMLSEATWESAVVYQVYWRSFLDGNGDGVGDLKGLRSKVAYLSSLGVDAIWLNPTYPSPQGDHGYDVSDYFDVDPIFGTLDELRAAIHDFHEEGIKVLLDIVPNHVSSQHPWFKAAIEGDEDGPEESRFIIRSGSGPKGASPPNDWKSIFGGPAWSRFPQKTADTQRWYLHMFDECQPDLNWENQEVHERFERILEHWYEIGVDGFRIDVAHGLYKAPGFPNMETFDGNWSACWDQPKVHEVYRSWRRISDRYEPRRFLIGEIHTSSRDRLLDYIGKDQLDAAFDFSFLHQPWSAEGFMERIAENLQLAEMSGSTPVWTLSNHDETRHWTRYCTKGNGEPTGELDCGTRYRSLISLMMSLPGRIFLYNGEELGLPQAEVPDDSRQDPAFFRQPPDSNYKGRDGCRVPLPWESERDNAGFSTTAPWLPMPVGWHRYSVDLQDEDPESMLNYYRGQIEMRKAEDWMGNGEISDLSSNGGVLSFVKSSGGLKVMVNLNFNDRPVPMDTGEVLFRSSKSSLVERDLRPGEIAFLILHEGV